LNRFIEECRREWKRLCVPDRVADEMAAELAADLAEAEADGAAPDELLGSGASDPRSFAAAWAAERGVVPPQSLPARVRRRMSVPAAIAVLTIVAAVGAALVIFASPDAAAPVAATPLPPLSAYPTKAGAARQMWVVAKTNGAVWVTESQSRASGVDIHRVGSILLIVGILGATLSLPFLFWSPRRFDTAQS
jgi:hypothetical protein